MIHQCYPDFKLFSRKHGENEIDPKNDRNEKIEDEPVNNDDDADVDIGAHDAESGLGDDNPNIDYFPWEPNYEPKARKIDDSTKPRNSLRKHNIAAAASTAFPSSRGSKTRTTKQCTEDLDFLATMSFANGGLRSPSCPCCI